MEVSAPILTQPCMGQQGVGYALGSSLPLVRRNQNIVYNSLGLQLCPGNLRTWVAFLITNLQKTLWGDEDKV